MSLTDSSQARKLRTRFPILLAARSVCIGSAVSLCFPIASVVFGQTSPPPQVVTQDPPGIPGKFVDISQSSGVRFQGVASHTSTKYLLETMGSGVAFFDYDNDGLLDIFFVNGAHLDNPTTKGTIPQKSGPQDWNRLYHQKKDGTFEDVTERSGLKGVGYGMGVAVGDFDNDGFEDLYVTAYGGNRLYHNNGNGSFTDITESSGTGGIADVLEGFVSLVQMNGSDPFGAPTINRPWMNRTDAMQAAQDKADAAFDLFRVLDLPFYTFHDRDITPDGETLRESITNLHTMSDYLAKKMESSKTRLLWGTANLFSHPRFMSGAATNPDPEVFAYSATTIKHCMDVTKKLGGENYVLWGGREGYETLLNTSLKRELEQMGRMLTLVVEYKHKIGFSGQILLEPKPKEPTVHQYDFDTATVFGFLKRFGLENEVKVNLEANHALLAGHTFEHEIAMAADLGILGSLDINRGDPLLGWDTDQFPTDLYSMTLAMYHVIQAGGLGRGGMNFEAKVRRQSTEPEDLLHAHIGGVDMCARAFLIAAKIHEEGRLADIVDERYAGWNLPENKAMLAGKEPLEAIAARSEERNINPQPRSGRQEQLENLINRHL